MNVELLRQIQQHILEEPKRLVMGAFVQRKRLESDSAHEYAHTPAFATQPFPACGTAACIAGWACLLSDGMDAVVSADRAQKLLQLKGEWGFGGEVNRLFEPVAWPQPYHDDYFKAETPELRVKVALGRIDHFIATEGRE